MFVLAGLLSAVTARGILGLAGRDGGLALIVLVAPVAEEVIKTGLALLLGADVFLTHVVFGGAELVADFSGGRGIWPGLAALALHSLLGFVTAWFLAYAGMAAVVPAAMLHAMWNYTALRLW